MTNLPPEAGDPGAGQVPPPAPQYQAPPPNYQAPPPNYQQAPPPGYQAPPPGYQQAPADPVNNIQLNYWLSVFFSWIPALIFYFMEKDKGDPRVRAFHAANLNFSLLRTAVAIAVWIIVVILTFALPWTMWGVIGILTALMWIINIGLAVIHLVAAISAANNFRAGQQPHFLFNVTLIK